MMETMRDLLGGFKGNGLQRFRDTQDRHIAHEVEDSFSKSSFRTLGVVG